MAAADLVASGSGMIGGGTPFGWASMGANVLGKVAGAATPAGPSSANSTFLGPQSAFDGSGWIVNMGAGSVDAPVGDRSSGGTSTAGTKSLTPYLIIAGAVLVGVLLWKKM